MAMLIIPRTVRGRLYFETADVLLPNFAQAAGVESHCPAFVAKDGAR